MVPDQMVTLDGRQTIAWWQLDPATGEVIDVSETGTHTDVVEYAGGGAQLTAINATLGIKLLMLTMRLTAWYAMRAMTIRYFELEALAPSALFRDRGTEQSISRTALGQTKGYMEQMIELILPAGLRSEEFPW
jgi:hypothetical protein